MDRPNTLYCRHDSHLPQPGSFAGRHVICQPCWRHVVETLRLSPRETEIAQLVFDDRSEAEMATTLGISRHTVHTHLERLYRKADVASRTQLMVRVFSTFKSLCQESQQCRVPSMP